MQGDKVRKSRRAGVCLVTFSAVALLIAGAAGAAVEKPAKAGTVKGVLSDQEWKAPVENVVVRMLDTATGKEYLSAPTDKRGTFEISGIAEGRYRLEVVSTEGAVDLKQSVLVKAGEVADFNLGVASDAVMPRWDVARGTYGMMESMCTPHKPPSPWKPPGKPPWVPGPPPWNPGD
jgi:hypothetical protein